MGFCLFVWGFVWVFLGFFPAKTVLSLAGKNLSQSYFLSVYLNVNRYKEFCFLIYQFFSPASVAMYTKALRLLIQFRNRFGQQSYTLGSREKTRPSHFQECIL